MGIATVRTRSNTASKVRAGSILQQQRQAAAAASLLYLEGAGRDDYKFMYQAGKGGRIVIARKEPVGAEQSSPCYTPRTSHLPNSRAVWSTYLVVVEAVLRKAFHVQVLRRLDQLVQESECWLDWSPRETETGTHTHMYTHTQRAYNQVLATSATSATNKAGLSASLDTV